MKTTEVPKFGNLSGLKVVHHGNTVAAPFAAELMAENGATVIELESAIVPDLGRFSPTPYGFISERRNNLALNLNLATAEGKEVFFKLVTWADILLEGQKGGTYNKWGLSDEVLWEHNPRLVIVHISGFGQSGHPDYIGRTSYDSIGQAFGGYMFLNGLPEPNPPLLASPYVCDYMSALFACWSALAAYINVFKTGKGESIDVSQFETMWKVQYWYPMRYFRDGVLLERSGNRDWRVSAIDVMKCKDGKYVFVSCAGAGPISRILPLIGLEGDPDFPPGTQQGHWGTPAGEKLHRAIEAFCEQHTAEEVDRLFMENDIPCSMVYNVEMAEKNPHVLAREVFVEWEDPHFGKVKGVNVMPHFKNNPGRIWKGAPLYGQDNEDILMDLGYNQEEIDGFYKKGVITKTPEKGGYRV